MPIHLRKPAVVEAAGNKPKLIREHVGRVSSKDASISIAHMTSPGGWIEPGQRPEFDEYTLVLSGLLRVEHEHGAMEITAGEAVITRKGEWVRYSTPDPMGADYIAVCLPAFSMETVHRDGA